MYHLLAIVRYRHGKFYFNASKIKHCYLQVLTIVLLTCIQARNPMQTQLCCGTADKLTANFTRGFRKDLRKKLKIFLVLYMHMNILKKSSTVGIINKLEIKNFLIEFTIIRNRKSFQVTDYSRQVFSILTLDSNYLTSDKEMKRDRGIEFCLWVSAVELAKTHCKDRTRLVETKFLFEGIAILGGQVKKNNYYMVLLLFPRTYSVSSIERQVKARKNLKQSW